ncbi:hypothetical protein TURU_002935 [Turdus rufiventris]|nr:hypothetical protein TURU_002935 [Turdus rufiventris]
MSNLQWLDISSNSLKDLPEDIDRLDELQTLLLQKNKLTYLPRALVNMPKLSLLVVSGDDLVEIPTAICESTTGLKFVSLKDSPVETIVCEDTEEIIENEREREQVEKEFMKAYIEDLKGRGFQSQQLPSTSSGLLSMTSPSVVMSGIALILVHHLALGPVESPEVLTGTLLKIVQVLLDALETSPDHYDSSNMMEKCLATSPLRTLDPCHQVLYTCGYSASSSVLKLAFH